MTIELIILALSLAKTPEPVNCSKYLAPRGCRQFPATMVFMNGSPIGNDDEVLTICGLNVK